MTELKEEKNAGGNFFRWNALLGQTLTFLILGAALMLGTRTIETIWPKPVRLVVCVEHPDTTRDCSKWKDIAR